MAQQLPAHLDMKSLPSEPPYKLLIQQGLPKRCDDKMLKTMLAPYTIKARTIKKPFRSPAAVFTYDSIEDLTADAITLNGVTFAHHTVSRPVVVEFPRHYTNGKKREADGDIPDADGRPAKRGRGNSEPAPTAWDPNDDIHKVVASRVASRAGVDYDESIRRDETDLNNALFNGLRNSRRAWNWKRSNSDSTGPDAPPQWLKGPWKLGYDSRTATSSVAVLKSPQVSGYRCKADFSIGLRPDNGQPCIGYTLGSWSSSVEGGLPVGPPDGTDTLHEAIVSIHKDMQKFMEESKLPVFDYKEKKGFWRQLVVRVAHLTGEAVIMIIVDPHEADQEAYSALKTRIHAWAEEKGTVAGLWWQEYHGTSSTVPFGTPVILGYAAPLAEGSPDEFRGTLEETLLGKKIRCGPLSFFQVNPGAAEVLFATAKTWADLSKDSTILLDLYCGTGTIGLSMVDSVKKVIGAEIVEEAIVSAKLNAKVNNVEDITEWHAGPMKAVLPKIVRNIESSDKSQILAVLDPPRSGLHPDVLKTLRKVSGIERLIYISCNPKALSNDVVGLTRPPSHAYQGLPFVPIKAIGVDMFPQTPHCELMVLFERLSDDNNVYTPPPERKPSNGADQAAPSTADTATTTTTTTTTTPVTDDTTEPALTTADTSVVNGTEAVDESLLPATTEAATEVNSDAPMTDATATATATDDIKTDPKAEPMQE